MIAYCYNLKYDREYEYADENIHLELLLLHVHAHMYFLGDKYDIPGLKKDASQIFEEQLTSPTSNSDQITAALLSIIPYIYTSTADTDHALRDSAVAFAIGNWTQMKSHPGIGDTIAENPEYGIDIISQATQLNAPTVSRDCSTLGCCPHFPSAEVMYPEWGFGAARASTSYGPGPFRDSDS